MARGEAIDVGNPGGVAGVAVAGDEQQVGLVAPAVWPAGADGFGGVLQRVETRARAPIGDVVGVVVAVVRGSPLVDVAVGAHANLHPLPVVWIKSLFADDRHAAQGGGVRVVGPVL